MKNWGKTPFQGEDKACSYALEACGVAAEIQSVAPKPESIEVPYRLRGSATLDVRAFLLSVLAGIAATVAVAAIAYAFRSRRIRDYLVLPPSMRNLDSQSYTHLNGPWYLYFLSYAEGKPSTPVWMGATQELLIQGPLVRTLITLTDHPHGGLRSKGNGEIRNGRMLITDACIEDESEFASVLYPNLRSREILVGTWTGLDNLLRPISAPCVLSREEQTTEQLNQLVTGSPIHLVPKGKYGSWKDKVGKFSEPGQDGDSQTANLS